MNAAVAVEDTKE